MSPPPGNPHYKRGVAFEREVKKALEAAGFEVCRTAGSKGTLFDFDCDLIASKETHAQKKEAYLVLVQCKTRLKKTKQQQENQ